MSTGSRAWLEGCLAKASEVRVLRSTSATADKDSHRLDTGAFVICHSWTSANPAKGYGPLIREYVFFLLAKLAFHRQHPEFNGLFEYEEYISLKSINDPNEG